MVLIRTTMTPTVAQEVSEATADDLRAQGALLEGTRAVTDDGLTEAALRQVRERALAPATREGIAEAVRRAELAERRRGASPQRPKRQRKSRAKAASSPAAPDAADAVTATPPGGDTLPAPGDPAPADVAPDPSGDDAPAAATTQES